MTRAEIDELRKIMDSCERNAEPDYFPTTPIYEWLDRKEAEVEKFVADFASKSAHEIIMHMPLLDFWTLPGIIPREDAEKLWNKIQEPPRKPPSDSQNDEKGAF